MISIENVTGDRVITATGLFNADGRSQQLSDHICGGTNLWSLLEHDNEYCTASGWGNNAEKWGCKKVPIKSRLRR